MKLSKAEPDVAGELICISPIDGEVFARRSCMNSTQIQHAVQSANIAQCAWAQISVAERAVYCRKAVDAMLAMEAEIGLELARQMGRPIRYALGELKGFQERALYMIEAAEAALAPVIPTPIEGFTRYIKKIPLGVVLTLAPWNYPYLTTVNSVIPALMAGNAVLLKSAQQTFLVGDRFEQAFKAAGLPEGLFHNLTLSHQQTHDLIAEMGIDAVCFTGSVAGGAAMETAASGRFIPVGLELGGKDAAYVRADANIKESAENLVDGAFFNSGQSCCGIERIYVHSDVYEEFLTHFVATTKAYVLGDPLDPATTLGPMASASAANFARKQVSSAVQAGASTHIDPALFPGATADGPYMAPQVLTGVDHSMSLMQEESFAPIVGIMKIENDADAIKWINDCEFGLTASIWTTDLAAAEHIGDQLDVGTVFMNRCDYLDPALAWVGVKNSGRGCSLSVLAYEQLTRPKSYHLRNSL